MSFSEVLDFYDVGSSRVSYEHISNSSLNKLAVKINQFRLEVINTYEQDGQLFDVLKTLKKCLFRLVTGLNTYDQIITSNLEREVMTSLSQVKASYPELFSSTALDIAKLLKELSETKENSLHAKIVDHLRIKKEDKGLRIAVVSKSALSEVEKELLRKKVESSFKIQFLTFSSFRKSLLVHNEVVYIGSPDYFGEAAKRNFNSKNLTFFSYDFFPNKIAPKNILTDIDHNGVFSTLFTHVNFADPLQSKEEIVLVEKEYKEEAVNQLIQQSYNITGESQDNTEAKVVTLENSRVIFIPLDAKVRIFSPNANNKRVVVQKSFIDVEEDDFIVIRNESDTKLIADIADKEILKNNAKKFRNRQHHWKKRLRSAVDKKGQKAVSDILYRKYKMNTASPASVRSWCSDESIYPRELNKLLEALKYKKEDIQKISNSMNSIKRAHISAGTIISKKLMSELSEGIHSELQEKGYYTFKSHEFNGASFNIERMVSIDHTIRSVPKTSIMRVINLD
ncbi:hypothetical protein [Pontibacillus litoralis]|uniref:Uncharacterized protein n=1 Tax=Pontibacillus litoralis JSM 072002 TaxID=1385512 RepID=A0A0A5G3R8_9BACI|nr:hypothetical protein [Pontibacillus litoralis]KGX85783.1 hypothetical protein N784_08250 [Pontibacillus litoralis JSM 072002]